MVTDYSWLWRVPVLLLVVWLAGPVIVAQTSADPPQTEAVEPQQKPCPDPNAGSTCDHNGDPSVAYVRVGPDIASGPEPSPLEGPRTLPPRYPPWTNCGPPPDCPVEDRCPCGECTTIRFTPPTFAFPPQPNGGPPVVEGDPNGNHTSITFHGGEGTFYYQSHLNQPPGPGVLGNTVETRSPDGTIMRYENANMPAIGGIRPFRPIEKIDPYDNRTQWEYDSSGRVVRVYNPNGVDEVWDYSPSWIGDSALDPSVWSDADYSGIEVRMVDRLASDQDLNRTTRRLFIRRKNSSGNLVPGCRPFAGDLLFRIYYPSGDVVDDLLDPFSSTLVDIATTAVRLPVTEFEYVGTYVGETSYVAAIRRFVASSHLASATTSNPQEIVSYGYVFAGGRMRVRSEVQPQTGRTYSFSYVDDIDSDQRVQLVSRVDQDLNERTWTLDDYERVTSVTVVPTNDVYGRPRAFDVDNGGYTEPVSITTNYTYSLCGVCASKPSVIEELPSGRRWEYDYDATTGLLLQSREPNPSGGSTMATTTFEWVPSVVGKPFGSYNLKSATYPDGAKWSFRYQSVAREDSSWGVKHQKVWTDSPSVAVVGSGTPVVITSEKEFNVANPTFVAGRQAAVVGQLVSSTDGDGVTTELAYDAAGALMEVTRSPGGGDEEVVTSLSLNRFGDVLQVTSNATSALPRITDYTLDGSGRLRASSTVVNGQTLSQEFYYDSLGNLVVHRTTNRSSSGTAPDDFGHVPRSDAARLWIRNEYHYFGDRLVMELLDRRALDRDDDPQDPVADATDARYTRHDFTWSPNGLLIEEGLENGAVVSRVFDGYGTLFKTTVSDGLGSSLLRGKYFVNSSLEVVRVVDGLGQATSILRNAAGFVTRQVDPLAASGTIPGTYPWSSSLPQRAQEFDRDAMGRLTEARVYEEAVSPLLFVRRTAEFDSIGRPYRVRVFEGGSSAASQEFTTTWEGLGKEILVTGPGGRFVARVFDASARLSQVQDSRSGSPNQKTYEYLPHTDYLSVVSVEDFDEDPGVNDYVVRTTEYIRDNLGRVLQLRQGPATAPLKHLFTYYSTGHTESYTDPLGKIERYLPDARGRLVERFRPGSDAIWNESAFSDWELDARTRLVQTDGRGRVTTSIYDFAGRMQVVMEPGATTEPTASAPHQAFAKFMEFDAASRLTDIRTGNDGHLHISYDSVGRMIMRQRIPVPSSTDPHISAMYGGDVLQRDVVGQVTESRSSYGSGWIYAAEQFIRDPLGRTHRERFGYETAGLASNWIDVESTFSALDPGDPIRVGLKYANGLAGGADDLWIHHGIDSAGRLSAIKWGTSSTTVYLASYLHEGRATRRRTTTLPSAPAFDTIYKYDDYGRMVKIAHSFSAAAEVQFVYDEASSLIAEEYAKQDGSVGDRFSYDEHNRLQKAWLGSDAAHMGAADPDGGVGTYVKRLTYDLDAANNRANVETQGGAGGPIANEAYETQDGSPQGPSNRYEAAGGVKPWYDDRGNLIFDGLRYYVYDVLNRLTEVYLVDSGSQQSQQSQQSMQMTSGSVATGPGPVGNTPATGAVYEIDDMSALHHARRLILDRANGSLGEMMARQHEPGFVTQMRQQLSPSVAHAVIPGGLSGGASMSSSGSFATSSSTAPDPGSLSMTLIAVYLYDAADRRVIRWLLYDRPYYYSWDGWEEAQELTLDVMGSAWVVRPVGQFAWGEQLDELVAYRSRTAGTWVDYYIAEGGSHCPSRVVDAQGAVVEVQEYDPYGAGTVFISGIAHAASQHGNPYQWKGHRHDPETGFLYMRHRFYAPILGRFVGSDPLGAWRDPGNYGSDLAYCGNEPLAGVDRYGLQNSTTKIKLDIGGEGAGSVVKTFDERTKVDGYRDGEGNEISTFGDLASSGVDDVQVRVDGEWRDLTDQEADFLADRMEQLAALVRDHNFMRAQILAYAAIAIGATQGVGKMPENPCPPKGGTPPPKQSGGTAAEAVGVVVNANSKLSKRAQVVYKITRTRSGKTETYKYGISSTGKNAAGASKRAQTQVNKLNKSDDGYSYSSEIVREIEAGQGARANALDMERSLVYAFKEATGAKPPGNIRP